MENLSTKRLLLRGFTLTDAKEVQKEAGSFEIYKTTLNIPYPYLDGLAEEWIKGHESKFDLKAEINYAIILKKTNKLIGAISLFINNRFNHAELGYWIAQDYWGQGYATEASQALLDYGFLQLGLNKIFAEHMKKNPASGRVMQKIGMRKEGMLRKHVLKLDKYQDIIVYGLLKEEYLKKFS